MDWGMGFMYRGLFHTGPASQARQDDSWGGKTTSEMMVYSGEQACLPSANIHSAILFPHICEPAWKTRCVTHLIM